MEVLYERCGALDVHKKLVVACVATPEGKETKTFGTMTSELLELADYLVSKGCTHVAMESTGVYWKPIYNILEGTGIEVLVVNARDIKAVPGRKTDVKDAEWICDLLRHGLLRGSFIPDRPQRELRELVRYRKELVRERAREVNRLQKVLEGANIKLGDVATDVMGKSGQAMIEALVVGETDPELLASLAKGRLKKKSEQLASALQGLIGPHQRMILGAQLEHIRFLDKQIERLNREVEERMRPFDQAVEAIDEIPGIGRRIAEEVLAETGTNMDRFPSAAHLASWAGLCPGNNESAGKRKSGRTRHGNPHLRQALVEAAQAAAHTKDTYLSAQYHRIAARRGAKRAAVAVAHSMIVIIYHMLREGTAYQDLGSNHFDELNRNATVRRAVKRLEALGYKVTLEEAA
ncbi:MAG: IS110 family transposase [Bacillota bacterium]